MSANRNLVFALRAGFVLGSLAVSVLLRPFGLNLLFSTFVTAFLSLAVLLLEQKLQRIRLATLIGSGLGLLLGLSLAALIVRLFAPFLPPGLTPFFDVFCPLAAGFLGLSLGGGKSGRISFPVTDNFRSAPATTVAFLDSSALVDGRIADLAEAGFLDSVFVVPQYVLNELQTIADTADAIRRNRGRRGLDTVARLQKASGVRVEISPADYGDIREVDLKLIEAAKERRARIVTTDCNLAKSAQAQGIGVLNINEVAAALRPVVLQGELLRVAIVKEGKEPAQGLAYLEDGTVVVVENARRQIGKTIEVIVTGVVQSVTGRMIFGRYEEGRNVARNRNAG